MRFDDACARTPERYLGPVLVSVDVLVISAAFIACAALAHFRPARNWADSRPELFVLLFAGSIFGSLALGAASSAVLKDRVDVQTMSWLRRMHGEFSGITVAPDSRYMPVEVVNGLAVPPTRSGRVAIMDRISDNLGFDHRADILRLAHGAGFKKQIESLGLFYTSPLGLQLPEVMLASTRAETGTVVTLDWGQEFSGTYELTSGRWPYTTNTVFTGHTLICRLSVLDLRHKLSWTNVKVFRGSGPRTGTNYSVDGTLPDLDDIESYIQKLPVFSLHDETPFLPGLLNSAAVTGRTEVVASLLLEGASANLNAEKGITPLHSAAQGGHEEVANLLLAHGAQVNAKTKSGNTPLEIAVQNGHFELVKLLLDRGADSNVASSGGITPLHTAYSSKVKPGDHVGSADDVAKLLLAAGANVNATNSYGQTPLHYAAGKEAESAVELMLAYGADANARDRNGWTPLHFAASIGDANIARLLLANGANVNASNNGGDTPLHVASANGKRNVVALLLAQKADANLKDNKGLTPLGAAEVSRSRDTVDLLRQRGTEH